VFPRISGKADRSRRRDSNRGVKPRTDCGGRTTIRRQHIASARRCKKSDSPIKAGVGSEELKLKKRKIGTRLLCPLTQEPFLATLGRRSATKKDTKPTAETRKDHASDRSKEKNNTDQIEIAEGGQSGAGRSVRGGQPRVSRVTRRGTSHIRAGR